MFNRKQYMKQYVKSPTGKAITERAINKYHKSSKCKETKKRYGQSFRGKESHKKYRQTLKGKIVEKKAYKKYRQSPKGKYDTYRQSLKSRYSVYKKSTQPRKLEWNLTLEQFKTFWQKSCYYCGAPILTIGLDRVDNTEGYTIDNVVPCCEWCNRMKLNYPKDEFIIKCKMIAKRF